MAKRTKKRERPTLAQVKALTAQVADLTKVTEAAADQLFQARQAAEGDATEVTSLERARRAASGLLSEALNFLDSRTPRQSRLIQDIYAFIGVPAPDYLRERSETRSQRSLASPVV